jgi:hypothetical protein
MRILAVLLAGLLTTAGLSACQTHVGAAAYVGKFRISEKTVDSYLTARAKPYVATTSTGSETIVPKPYVLTLLMEQRIFQLVLAQAGGPPTATELTKAHDTVLANTNDAAVSSQFTVHGFGPSLEPMLIKTVELNQLLSTRFATTAARARAVALLQKFGATARVSPRYGTWDAKNFVVTGTSKPSFLRLNPTAAATTAPAS